MKIIKSLFPSSTNKREQLWMISTRERGGGVLFLIPPLKKLTSLHQLLFSNAERERERVFQVKKGQFNIISYIMKGVKISATVSWFFNFVFLAFSLLFVLIFGLKSSLCMCLRRPLTQSIFFIKTKNNEGIAE